MYTTCPKCQYVRQTTDDANPDICPACEIIFSKWMKQQFSSPTTQKNIYKNQATNFNKNCYFFEFGKVLVRNDDKEYDYVRLACEISSLEAFNLFARISIKIILDVSMKIKNNRYLR